MHILLFLLLLVPSAAFSCSCYIELDNNKADHAWLDTYAVIVAVPVKTDVKKGYDPAKLTSINIATYQILEVLSGPFKANDLVNIDGGGGMCGIFPSVGNTYLIRVSRNLTSSTCASDLIAVPENIQHSLPEESKVHLELQVKKLEHVRSLFDNENNQ